MTPPTHTIDDPGPPAAPAQDAPPACLAPDHPAWPILADFLHAHASVLELCQRYTLSPADLEAFLDTPPVRAALDALRRLASLQADLAAASAAPMATTSLAAMAAAPPPDDPRLAARHTESARKSAALTLRLAGLPAPRERRRTAPSTDTQPTRSASSDPEGVRVSSRGLSEAKPPEPTQQPIDPERVGVPPTIAHPGTTTPPLVAANSTADARTAESLDQTAGPLERRPRPPAALHARAGAAPPHETADLPPSPLDAPGAHPLTLAVPTLTSPQTSPSTRAHPPPAARSAPSPLPSAA
jgi:hypothetical protein